MSIEKTFQGWRLSTMHKGYRFSRHYIGYTKAQAIHLFSNELEAFAA